MSVYRLFDRNDIFSTTVYTAPRVRLASGTTGWRGNMGVSSSLSLYPGIRSRRDVKSSDFVSSGISVYPLDPLDTHSIDKVIFVSGSYPSTGSVQFVKVRTTPYTTSFAIALNHDNWYDEHFRPIELLYSYYSGINTQYFTGSYDFYSLFFNQNVSNSASHVSFSGSYLQDVTGTFTMECWIKPLHVTGSQDFVLQSQRSRFRFFITGSTGKLAFSDFRGTTLTGSTPLTRGVWQHVLFMASGSSGSFYINGDLADRLAYTGTLNWPDATILTNSSSLVVGAQLDAAGTTPMSNNGFRGFLFESRVWNVGRTPTQISSSWNRTLIASGSSNLLHYARFNDGPLSTLHGFASGSGSWESGRAGIHGKFGNFIVDLPLSPLWQPNDNFDFLTVKKKIDIPLNMVKVIHVPSMFYGRQIATGSVILTCNGYDGKGIQRVLIDDGRGSLFVSGSLLRPITSEEPSSVRWNKVGNVFYTEGLIVLTDPSLLDFGERKDWGGVSDILHVQFDGVNRIQSKTFVCRLGPSQGNASNNPSYVSTERVGDLEEETGRDVLNGDATTWISAVGIYNEDRKLVAVAKLASPIRKREKDKLVLKLRMDF